MALAECRECGDKVSTEAESCPHCGAPTSKAECWECGREVERGDETCPHCGVSDPAKEAARKTVREVKPYYREQFRKFENNDGNYVFTWNWPAFLFGVFWYFYRGLWAKALILTLIAIVTGGALFIFIWIWCGAAGNYDYYLLVEEGTQLYPSVA